MSRCRGACWQFTSALAPERAARLISWRSFDEIVESLATCHIAPLYWEPATKQELKGCHRASFVLTVLPDVYDAFFNAPVGYRGQFSESETQGEAANRKIIETLLSRLLEVAAEHSTATRQSVVTSLQGKQAKVWIDETEVDNALTDPTPLIDYRDWEFNDPDGQGLRAPRGTKLEVKGGWVRPTGEAVINPGQNNRSRNINRTGYSG
jgi:hypothetical protein